MTFQLWHVVVVASALFMVGFAIGAWWSRAEPVEETHNKTCEMLMRGDI